MDDNEYEVVEVDPHVVLQQNTAYYAPAQLQQNMSYTASCEHKE